VRFFARYGRYCIIEAHAVPLDAVRAPDGTGKHDSSQKANPTALRRELMAKGLSHLIDLRDDGALLVVKNWGVEKHVGKFDIILHHVG
jgi:hypothetical protein